MGKFSEMNWSLVPGPRQLPKPIFPSDRVTERLVAYEPRRVAEALSSLEGVIVTSTNNKDGWAWRGTFESEDDIFDIGFSLFETSPPMWGGSELIGISKASAALDLLSKLRLDLPAVYLHSSEALFYTPEGFRLSFLET